MDFSKSLKDKKNELQIKYDSLNYASVAKNTLKSKIEILSKLIDAYDSFYNNPTPALDLDKIQQIFSQYYGLEKEKQKILEWLEIRNYKSLFNFEKTKNNFIWCLVGPPGTGKSTFASLLSQVLNKKLFSFHLGGMNDPSLLKGKEEEIGLLVNALVKTESIDPLFLLDEIDKTSIRVQDSLLNILDNVQNNKVFNHYLDTDLDFSKINFIITVNDFSKLSDSLRSRIELIIKITPYTLKQKLEISRIVIKKFLNNYKLDSQNLEITTEALETLINKTKEGGVRQLETLLEKNIFNYCLLQWAKEISSGKKQSKIVITPEIVNKIVPSAFFNFEQEKNDLKQNNNNNNFKESTNNNQEEKNKQKISNYKRLLLVLIKNNEKKLGSKTISYEEEVKRSNSWEELSIIRKDIFFQIEQKFSYKNHLHNNRSQEEKPKKTPKPSQEKKNDEKDKSSTDKSKFKIEQLKKQNRELKKISLLITLFSISAICFFLVKWIIEKANKYRS